MRGRLIWPFLAEIAQYDADATDADPDGTGPLTSGFDDVLMEPVRIADGSESGSHSARKEKAAIRVRCQFEDNAEEQARQLMAGAAPRTSVICTFHFSDLERAGLVDATTGDPKLHNGDRLAGLYRTDGTLVRTFANPPGLFATAIKPSGFGLSSKTRNLLLVTFEDREQGVGA